MLLLRGEPAHRAEARKDQRVHAGLGPAGQHGVRIPSLDELCTFADGVRAGRTGGDRRVVWAPDSEGDRELPARGIDEHARDEARGDAACASLTENVSLVDDPAHAADRGPE